MNKESGSILAIILAIILACGLVAVQAYILYVIVSSLFACGHITIGWVVIISAFASVLLKGRDN